MHVKTNFTKGLITDVSDQAWCMGQKLGYENRWLRTWCWSTSCDA